MSKAFKDECREGKLYEDTINLPNSFERIDGSFRNTPTGKTFTASLMDCRDNWDSTKLHMDYVDQQSKILVDVKTSTMTGKCFSKALIQLQAFKNKFPDYKTIYIYKGIKNRDTISYLKRLMNMGLLDDYHSRGVNMVKLESMMNGDAVNLEKFFQMNKETKRLILVMLPKWVALLGMIVLMIKLMQLKRVVIGLL